jgi:nicotinamidase/pyrazinamidase
MDPSDVPVPKTGLTAGRRIVMAKSLSDGDGLLVIDVQNDFCPSGALPVEDGDRVVPVLNRWLRAAGECGIPVYASRDWHPRGHPSFVESGGEWPAHCIQDTDGAQFHADLELPDDVVLVAKGVRFDCDQYSAFHETGLEERLRRDGVRRLWVGGLALDVCVRATVLDALRAGLEVRVLVDATRPVEAEDGRSALVEMESAGAVLEVEE